MTLQKHEYYLKGVPISEGIAIGKLHLFTPDEDRFIPEVTINSEEVDREIQRYRTALSSSRQDLKQLQEVLSDEGSHEAVTIIDTHIQMLEDPLITTFVEQKIKQMLQNTESVFRSVMGEYEKRFVAIDDTFKQRLTDVRDVSQRILRHLHSKPQLPAVPDNAVIFSKELVPSHTAEACVSRVCAFLSELGGKTSHAALIARAKGIPYVANIDMEQLTHVEGDIVIVDGCSGHVILNPSAHTIESYSKLKEDIFDAYQKLVDDMALEGVTKDGKKIGVWANIETMNDLQHPYFSSAEGVGLFRSEFFFPQKEILTVSEEEQYALYVEMIHKTSPLPIIFRVFDLGGDKGLAHEAALDELNPALGCRAIRFLLHDQAFFKRQLRAILRASVNGSVSLLFPLITDIDELREVKRIVEEAKMELTQEGYSCAQGMPMGCMIEMPSAALTCHVLAKESDFFSIGTNDLIQYALATDRSHPWLHTHYRPAHPCIIELLHRVVEVGRLKRKPVSICGEMAANPLFTQLLVGLGIEQLSCPPRYIPLIKKTIRSFSYQDAKQLAEHILHLESAYEIEQLLIKEHNAAAEMLPQ
jgi:phosphoenolpyruvate-protein phosphotransferase (PTS system enzyme I)